MFSLMVRSCSFYLFLGILFFLYIFNFKHLVVSIQKMQKIIIKLSNGRKNGTLLQTSNFMTEATWFNGDYFYLNHFF